MVFKMKQAQPKSRNAFLSHDNPCFQCKIAITNFVVAHTCEIRFNDVIGLGTQKFQNMADLHGRMSMFRDLIFFNIIPWIQLCDKKNLTFVNVVIKCC